MEQIKFKITGTVPLLMHNGNLADQLNPYTLRMSELNTKKKSKGVDKLAILKEMAEVEWEGGLYHTETTGVSADFVGPYVPGTMLRACLVAGAKMSRGGASVQRAVTVPLLVPLVYDGPKTLDELKADRNFHHSAIVRVAQARISRMRPIFNPPWSVTFEVSFNPNAIARDDLIRYMDDAGTYHGFGDGRTQGFGRFQSQVVEARGRLAAK